MSEPLSPRPRGVSRRRLLAGGVGAAAAAVGAGIAVDRGIVPGRASVFRALGLNGEDGAVPAVAPLTVRSGFMVSEARLGARCHWQVVAAGRGLRDLPVAVVLHGRGGSVETVFDQRGLGLGNFLAEAVTRGSAPFALAAIDGGDTYWHPRDSGEDAGAMVADEFVPMLDGLGLDTSRLAFMGWSMGGYGALRLGGLVGAPRVKAVAALSPALFGSFSDAAPGSFDSAADLADAQVFGRQDTLDGVSVRIDCGESDPFYAANVDYRRGFSRAPAGGFELGGHDMGFWRRMAPAHVRLVSRALAG